MAESYCRDCGFDLPPQTAPGRPRVVHDVCPDPVAEFCQSIRDGWNLDERHEMILTMVANTLRDVLKLESILREDGLIVTDRFGQKKAHPAATMLRQSRTNAARLVRELALDTGDEGKDWSVPEFRPPRQRGVQSGN